MSSQIVIDTLIPLIGKVQGSQTQKATPNSRETLQVTDALRKIQTDQSISPEARKEKAQDFLAKIMSKRGVSIASGTFSHLR